MSHQMAEVIKFLKPDSSFVLYNESVEDIVWLSDGSPPSRQEIEDAIPQFEESLANAENEFIQRRELLTAKLNALGLTADEIAVILNR